jgi:hypothetical protein
MAICQPVALHIKCRQQVGCTCSAFEDHHRLQPRNSQSSTMEDMRPRSFSMQQNMRQRRNGIFSEADPPFSSRRGEPPRDTGIPTNRSSGTEPSFPSGKHHLSSDINQLSLWNLHDGSVEGHERHLPEALLWYAISISIHGHT